MKRNMGIPQCQINCVQKVLISAANIITLSPKFHHITPVLLQLHWLPINFLIQFKLIIINFLRRFLFHFLSSFLK
ncbi:hypothetical protein P5673_011321 [Acropora cervicornis]|uniref:Uncharacterized protein n=1 Tax=Acropora cervicornis TaxID=6130 RepID=A0AAD9V8M6_ACRCE|nr:hypothetical protein P5673_011321 [Acropora cervicornis]